MITYSGRRVFPEWDARHTGEMPSLNDICRSLSRIIRFAGQTEDIVTVATHSIIVSKLVDPRFTLAALLHDSIECVVGDRIGTWKTAHESDIEDALYRRICESVILESDVVPGDMKNHPHITYSLFSDDAMRAVEKADYAAVCCEAVAAGHSDRSAFTRQPRAFVETAEYMIEAHSQVMFEDIEQDLSEYITSALNELVEQISEDERRATLDGAIMFTQPVEADR